MTAVPDQPGPGRSVGTESNGAGPGASGRPPADARPWPSIGPVRRLGPVVVIVLALIAAGTIATVRSTSSPASSATPGPHQGSGPALPVTYQQAAAQGRQHDYHWGSGCDPTTGRLRIPSPTAQPCVPVFTGANGGSTWTGVTGSTITVAYYLPPPGGLTSLLPGATDPPAITMANAQAMVTMLNKIVPLYGRHVVLVAYHGTGGSSDAVAGRADAITVAQSLHAFASINGPAQTSAYQDELARQHVLCIDCGLGVPYADYQQNSPYLWGLLPTPDTLLNEALDFVVGQLVGKHAIYAGEASMRTRTRTFAVVAYQSNPPVFGALTAELDKKFTPLGLRTVTTQNYLLDLPQLPSEAATIAAHLKRSGATTVIFAGDPLMPIYLTRAAAAIGYFPEWIVTGTVFTDTSTLARYYDQSEWSHAFGISSLPVPLPPNQNEARTLFRWYYGTDPQGKTANVILQPIELLYNGLELAGPDLTPFSFRGGMFNYPPTGGGPTQPLIAYGNRGALPRPSYSSPADFTILWWDPTAHGPDEEGVVGTGLYRYADGGKRYRSTVIPRGATGLHQLAGSVTSYAVPPPSDRAPSYPPWPGSPAARAAKG